LKWSNTKNVNHLFVKKSTQIHFICRYDRSAFQCCLYSSFTAAGGFARQRVPGLQPLPYGLAGVGGPEPGIFGVSAGLPIFLALATWVKVERIMRALRNTLNTNFEFEIAIIFFVSDNLTNDNSCTKLRVLGLQYI